MKKATAFLLALLLLFALTGCGAQNKLAEGIAGKVLGDDVEVDLDDGKIKIKGDDGQEWTAGGGEWPREGAGAVLPEFKKGKIVQVLNTAEGSWVHIDEITAADYEQYVNTLKEAGYNQNETVYSSDGPVIFAAEKEGVGAVSITFHSEGSAFISFELKKEEAEE